MGLQIKCTGKLVQLLIRFTFALMHDFFDLSRSLVKEMIAASSSLILIYYLHWHLSMSVHFSKPWHVSRSGCIDNLLLTVLVSLNG